MLFKGSFAEGKHLLVSIGRGVKTATAEKMLLWMVRLGQDLNLDYFSMQCDGACASPSHIYVLSLIGCGNTNTRAVNFLFNSFALLSHPKCRVAGNDVQTIKMFHLHKPKIPKGPNLQ